MIWEFVTVFMLRAVVEEQCGKPESGSTDNKRIELPIARLCVPATGGRPDVSRVAVIIIYNRQ